MSIDSLTSQTLCIYFSPARCQNCNLHEERENLSFNIIIVNKGNFHPGRIKIIKIQRKYNLAVVSSSSALAVPHALFELRNGEPYCMPISAFNQST